jgi:hypothetical protein
MAGDVNAMFNQSKVLQDLGTTIPGRELYEGAGEAGDVDARTDSPLFAGQIRSRAPLGRSRLTAPSTPALVVIALTLMGLVLRVAIVFRPLALIDRLFIPDDTYYTLTIARSIAHGHGPTVDGTTITSGFQPLLAFLMTPVFWLTNSADAALRGDLALLVVVDTATIAVLAWVAYRLAGRVAAIVAAALWAISPVAVGMSLGGLETSLAIFLEISVVALWIWANDRPTALRWGMAGAVAGLAVLGRIDALLLLGLLALVQLWRGPRRPLVLAAAGVVAIVAPWWVWCTLTLGTPLPTSGPAAHQILPFPSFSNMTTSLAAGAVSGGPFQPWDWLRSRLIGQPAGVLLFWLLVLGSFGLAVRWVVRRPRQGIEDPASLTGPGVRAVVGTLPAFAAGLLLFYAWFGVTFYLTRYLAPVAMVLVVVVAAGVGRLASGHGRRSLVALLGASGILVIPTVAAVQLDTHYATTRSVPAVRPWSPHFYDAITGYREVTTAAVRVPPPGSVIGGWQSGALSYFADRRLTVVNLDGVANPVAFAAAKRDGSLAEYIRSRHIGWLADFPVAVLRLDLGLRQLDSAPKVRNVATLPPSGPSPGYVVDEIIWSGR